MASFFSNFSDIKHPIEGIAYIFLIGIVFRLIWPKPWNEFLRLISAKDLSKK